MNAYLPYCVGGFPTLNIDLSTIDLWYIVWYGYLGTFKGLSKYEGPYFHAPKLQNQHGISNIRRIEGYPHGPANDPQSM